jgi:hypothetical protein
VEGPSEGRQLTMCACNGTCPSCPDRQPKADTATVPLRFPVPICDAPADKACKLGYTAKFRAIAVSGLGCQGCAYLHRIVSAAR